MADYRRELSKYDQRNILDKYKEHRDAVGGIFTPDKRRKLLGIKAESGKRDHQDTAEFWYDVRTTVKSGLKDLELLCDVANPKQLEEIFTNGIPLRDELKGIHSFMFSQMHNKSSALENILAALLQDYNHNQTSYTKKSKNSKADFVSEDVWQAYRASNIIFICMDFFKRNNFISTKAHKILVEQVEDMISVEVYRGVKQEKNQRPTSTIEIESNLT
ncbi:MAG: hypothetical protein ACYDAJ_04500 [Nitrosotalea sp.]